ncbi:MAG: AAA family ATPase [Lachnospiraceae bacterium]|nr:AAA family ATPase [Lachnospiraceae bacterium]
MKIIGQTRLLEKLNKYTLTTLPKTLLFIGEEGCGKHTMIKQLAQNLQLDTVEITDKITAEDLIEFSQKTVPTVYIIDLTAFTEKQQNQFLKFIEEPSESVFTILIASSEIGILPTILNRCVKLRFDPYTKEELQEIANRVIDSELVFEICKTPGQIVNLSLDSFNEMYALCEKLVLKTRVANYPNLMKVAVKINYKEDFNKFDFNLFFNTLEYVAFSIFKNTNNEDAFKTYCLTNQFKQARINKSIAKEAFMLNFLTQLWKELHQ